MFDLSIKIWLKVIMMCAYRVSSKKTILFISGDVDSGYR